MTRGRHEVAVVGEPALPYGSVQLRRIDAPARGDELVEKAPPDGSSSQARVPFEDSLVVPEDARGDLDGPREGAPALQLADQRSSPRHAGMHQERPLQSGRLDPIARGDVASHAPQQRGSASRRRTAAPIEVEDVFLELALAKELEEVIVGHESAPQPGAVRRIGSKAPGAAERGHGARPVRRQPAMRGLVQGEAAQRHAPIQRGKGGEEQLLEREGHVVGDVLVTDLVPDVLPLIAVQKARAPDLQSDPLRPGLGPVDPSDDRSSEQQAILALEVDRLSTQESVQRRLRRPARRAENRRICSLHERQALGVRQHLRRGVDGDDPAATRQGEIVANVDERLGQGPEAVVLSGVQYRHLVVAVDRAAPVQVIDLADSFHAEAIELGGAQGSHARGAQDTGASLQRQQ